MIGVFDSGVGGFCAYARLRRLLPFEDIVYVADRKNAPYGTKTKEEILSFTKNNIRALKNLGARAVLIACCSASSVYPLLSEEEKRISFEIITPAATIASKTGARIGVIATRHTVKQRAFTREIQKRSDSPVTEWAEQELVRLVEDGNRDGRISVDCRAYLTDMTERLGTEGIDTLILGCTHFSHLKGEIGRLMPEVKIISPADVGAEELVKKIKHRRENGRVTYV